MPVSLNNPQFFQSGFQKQGKCLRSEDSLAGTGGHSYKSLLCSVFCSWEWLVKIVFGIFRRVCTCEPMSKVTRILKWYKGWNRSSYWEIRREFMIEVHEWGNGAPSWKGCKREGLTITKGKRSAVRAVVLSAPELSRAQLSATLWTAACQPVLSMTVSGKDPGVGCHFLVQGIFLTQGQNLRLLHCRRILEWLSHDS